MIRRHVDLVALGLLLLAIAAVSKIQRMIVSQEVSVHSLATLQRMQLPRPVVIRVPAPPSPPPIHFE